MKVEHSGDLSFSLRWI